VSRVELAQGARLMQSVRNALEASGMPPQSLQLEVTEREVMRDPQASLALMQQLRQIGVRLAMDDFGTGTGDRHVQHDLFRRVTARSAAHA
jgi:EAL domain-containing protein (putative c-di-GMP-specific phosphodiesterase class I)